jgi:hypothetical protein
MVFFLLLPLVILFGVVVVVIRWIDGRSGTLRRQPKR